MLRLINTPISPRSIMRTPMASITLLIGLGFSLTR